MRGALDRIRHPRRLKVPTDPSRRCAPGDLCQHVFNQAGSGCRLDHVDGPAIIQRNEVLVKPAVGLVLVGESSLRQRDDPSHPYRAVGFFDRQPPAPCFLVGKGRGFMIGQPISSSVILLSVRTSRALPEHLRSTALVFIFASPRYSCASTCESSSATV